MTGLWETKAMERHEQIKVPLDKLLASHDMLRSAIGQTWLDEQAALVDRSGSPFEASQLYRILVDPTETALIETCELALYLESFKDDPAVQTVINDLKSHKYEAVLFELGLAYRWKIAGADVRLHPITPKGKVADYAATIDDLLFMVEASSFPGGDATRIPFLIVRCVEANLKKELAVNVKVRITEYPVGNFDALLHSRVRAACTAFRDAHETGTQTPYSSTESFGTIEIELRGPDAETNPFTMDEYKRIVSVRDHHWHAVIACRSVAVGGTEALYRTAKDQPDDSVSSMVFVRFPTEDRDVFKELRTKLQTERKQLSGITGPRVIALDATSLTDTLRLNSDGVRQMILPFMRSAPSLACVWLVMRRWQTSLRYRYEGLYIENPESTYKLPNWFVSNLFQNEFRLDFLTGKILAAGTQEEDERAYAERMQ
jgi:hypothetical protein